MGMIRRLLVLLPAAVWWWVRRSRPLQPGERIARLHRAMYGRARKVR